MGQRLLRQRQVALAQDAVSPVAGHRLSGRGDRQSHRPCHAGRVARTPARTRHRRPARRRLTRGGGFTAQWNHRPGQAHDLGHPAARSGSAGAVPAGMLLPVAPLAGLLRQGQGFGRGRRQGIRPGTEQPLRQRPDCEGAARLRPGIRIERRRGAANAARKLPADGARHHDRRVPHDRQRGTQAQRSRWAHTLRAADPRRGAAIHRRIQRPLGARDRGGRGRVQTARQPGDDRGRGAERADGRALAAEADGPVHDPRAAVGRRSRAGDAQGPAAQEARVGGRRSQAARRQRRRDLASVAGHAHR